jgi:hypothetical protein
VIFDGIVTKMALEDIVAAITLDTIVACIVPLVAMLTSSSMMWCKDAFGIVGCSEEYNFGLLSLKRKVRLMISFCLSVFPPPQNILKQLIDFYGIQ